MKKGIVVLIAALLVLISTGLWLFSASGNLKTFDIVSFGIIMLVMAFALFVGYKRVTSAKRGEPAEDEMSKKVMLKTSSLSYYISLYLWLALMYFSDRLKFETHTMIGAGLLGMALIFAVCWIVFNFRGVRNE